MQKAFILCLKCGQLTEVKDYRPVGAAVCCGDKSYEHNITATVRECVEETTSRLRWRLKAVNEAIEEGEKTIEKGRTEVYDIDVEKCRLSNMLHGAVDG